MTTHSRTRLANPLCIVLAVGAALVWVPGRALAQGTSGTVPDPISSRELNEYSQRLQLTGQQWVSIEGFFEQYRAEFKALRETDIEAYLQNTGGLWMRGFRSLNRESIEGNMKQLDRLLARIRNIDNRLFEQIQGVLDEDQVARIPQVMQARERQRYAAGASRVVGWSNRASRVDLADLYRQLELSEAEARETDPYVTQYEAQLTKATRELFETSSRIFLDIVEYMEGQGIDPETLADGESRRQMMSSMMEAWAEVSRKPREKAADIADLNRKTVRQVTELLGPAASTELRTSYLRRAYPEIRAASGAQRAFEQALQLEALTGDLRAEVEGAAEQYRIQRRGLTDEATGYLDEYRRESSPFRFGREGREEHQQKLDGFRERIRDTDRNAVVALEAVLGPDLAGQIDAVVIGDGSGGGDDGRGRGGGSARRQGERGNEFGPDKYLSQAMGHRTVLGYSEQLGLSSNDSFIFESLYEDYLSSFHHLQGNEIARLDEARRALQQAGEQDPDARTPEQIDEVFTLRKRALSATVALDDSFFDDLKTLVSSDAQLALVDRLRQTRQRAVYSKAIAAAQPDSGNRRGRRGRGSWRGMGNGSAESAVDVSAVVAGVELPQESRSEADGVLGDYETQVTDEFHKQYEAAIDLSRQSERMWMQAPEWGRGGGDDEERRQRFQAFRESSARYTQQMSEARKPVLEMNRQAMAALTDALPADAVTAIKRAYNRRAFPGVYRDPRSAQQYLSRALELPEVTQDQTGRIQQILAEFRPAYEAASDRMAELNANTQPMDWSDRNSWRSATERRNKMEALEFDRNEVSAKALRGLRDVLSEKQVELLDLPEPGERRN